MPISLRYFIDAAPVPGTEGCGPAAHSIAFQILHIPFAWVRMRWPVVNNATLASRARLAWPQPTEATDPNPDLGNP